MMRWKRRTRLWLELMDVVVKKSLTERPEIRNFMNRTQKRYSTLMDSSGKEEMDLLEERISEIVRKYVPNARVHLSWRSTEMRVEYPKAEASLVEDNYRFYGKRGLATACNEFS